MNSPTFPKFNNVDLPPKDSSIVKDAPLLEMSEVANKIIRELLRRSEHGIEESRFIETNGELLKILYPITVIIQAKLAQP